MLKAIEEFPTPTSIKGIRSWFGLVAFVSYAYSLSAAMLPFRELLASKQKFHWDSALDEIFTKAKSFIVEKVVEGVKMFDILRHTCLATDWSKSGIGFSSFRNIVSALTSPKPRAVAQDIGRWCLLGLVS